MNAIHSPDTRPRPRNGMCAPSIMVTPATMNNMPTAWPTPAAQRVALVKSRVAAHSPARSTRPPSSGNPGIRLNRPSMMLIGPSQSSTVANGLAP